MEESGGKGHASLMPHQLRWQGAATRMVGKTVFNPRSSRSHAVVMLLG